MTWRKPSEGLLCSTRGKKEGNDGRMAYFVLVVVYNKGVILCKQYNGTLTGESFAELSGPIFQQLLKELKIFMENYFYKMVILVKCPDVLKMPWMMLVVACLQSLLARLT